MVGKSRFVLLNFFITYLAFFLIALFADNVVFAVDVSGVRNLIPASTEPGVLSKTLAPTAVRPTALPAIRMPEEKVKSNLGPKATEIKFKLEKIILEGNIVYSDQVLSQLYKDKLHTIISVADLEKIVQSITNYYRNNGYILSRAILPPQHVLHGIVTIRVIEGYIDDVHVIGKPKGSRAILLKYGQRISQSKPLQIKVMEHYLRLANEIPGMKVRAVLEPSKTNVGASTLDLAADQQSINGSLSYDDYGTRYIGPLQLTGVLSANSVFLSGDTTRLVYVTTTRPRELRFYDLSYQAYAGASGFTWQIGKNRSATEPGLNLRPLDILGISDTYYLNLVYPLLRSRENTLSLDGGFNYFDSQVTTFQTPLYTDHIRSIRFGGTDDFADKFKGSNILGLHVEQGLSILGGSNNSNSQTTSRFGADGVYTKINLQYARLQQIYGRLTGFFVLNGQYAFEPLLSSVQFGFGGNQLGRGYDPAEIIGDRGLGSTVELRMDFAPGWYLIQTVEPYIFYDAGVVWNVKNIIGTPTRQDATSTGLGMRFVFNQYLSGNLMFTQPLSKQVLAENFVDQGKIPRVFFSIVAAD